jgi:multidrug resistance efflux pump
MNRFARPALIALPALLAATLACPPARAGGRPADAIYVCTDGDGHRSYQSSAEGASCHLMVDLVASIPAADAARGQRTARSVPRVSPASFPRVDSGTQRQRDADRRRILLDELADERQRLQHLHTDFNQGHPAALQGAPDGTPGYQERVQRLRADIERSQDNIASLQRELGPVRY